MPTLENPALETFAQHYATHRSTPLAAAASGLPANIRPGDRPEVVARVQEIWGIAMSTANITPERVMRELERIAFQDIRPIFDTDGNLKPIHMLDDDTAATIASVDVEVRWQGRGDDMVPVTTKKVRRVDKMAALNVLARHFKIVGDDNEGVNALASALADRLKNARNRVFAQDAEDARIMNPPPLLPPDQSEKAKARSHAHHVATYVPRKVAAQTEPSPMESNDEQLW